MNNTIAEQTLTRNRQKNASFAAGLFVFFLLLSMLSELVSPYRPGERFAPFQQPCAAHWLGTDDLGSDIFSELVQGVRVSLWVGIGTAAVASFFGLLIGLFSGYYRGLVDEILMGLTDIFLMIPRIPLLIVIAAFSRPGFLTISLLFGLLWWPSTARVIRSKVLQVREAGFIRSAQCFGFSNLFILRSEILPNIIHVLAPKFMLTFASAIIAEASISFLGMGDPAAASWGGMLNAAFMQGGFINNMWWWYVPPGICITLVVLSVVMLGNSFERKFNKHSSGRVHAAHEGIGDDFSVFREPVQKEQDFHR